MENLSNINNNEANNSSYNNNTTTIEGVSHFIRKLRDILTDENKEEYHRIISWNDEGDIFIIKNATKFSKHISPKYYKHSNFASFVRQLNSYGFTKVKGSSQCIAKFTDAVHKFKHPYFKRDRPDLLPSIYRKSARPYHSFSYYNPPSTKRTEGLCVVASSTSPPPPPTSASSSSSPPPSSNSSSPDRDEYNMNYSHQNSSHHHNHHYHSHHHHRLPQNDEIYLLHRSRSDDHSNHSSHHHHNNNITNVANLLIAKKTTSYPSSSSSSSSSPSSTDRDHYYRSSPIMYKSNTSPYMPPTQSATHSPSSSLFQPMIMLKNAAVDQCVKDSISPPILHPPSISSPSSNHHHLPPPNLPCRNSSLNHLLNNNTNNNTSNLNINSHNHNTDTTNNNNNQHKMNITHYLNNNCDTSNNNISNNINSNHVNSSSSSNNSNNSNSNSNSNSNNQQCGTISLPPIAQWEKMISRTLEFDTKLYVYGQKSEVYNSYSFKPSTPPKRPVDEKPNLFYDLCSKDIPSFVTISRTLPPHTY